MRLLTHMSHRRNEFRHINIIIIRDINKHKLGFYEHRTYQRTKKTLGSGSGLLAHPGGGLRPAVDCNRLMMKETLEEEIEQS